MLTLTYYHTKKKKTTLASIRTLWRAAVDLNEKLLGEATTILIQIIDEDNENVKPHYKANVLWSETLNI